MSIYDLLFEKDLGKWSIEFNKYKKAVKFVSKLIDIEEKKYGEYYPKKENLFRAFECTPLEKVKVVIWGEAPYTATYNNKPIATGLSFNTNEEVPLSLAFKNIYKEIKSNFPTFNEPENGDLSYLTKEGVLFLNRSFTVCPDDKNVYKTIWISFITIVIKIINENIHNCIHILWGTSVSGLEEFIKSRNIFTSSHPSVYKGFLGNRHFLKINITLKKEEKGQINFNKDKNLVPTFLENIKNQ
jgi:uracil-DNA glycosylase